jgi:hypothetical protein
MSVQTILTVVFWLVPIVFAGGVAGLTVKNTQNDLKGLSKKCNRLAALLVRWADTEERRKSIADFLEGK